MNHALFPERRSRLTCTHNCNKGGRGAMLSRRQLEFSLAALLLVASVPAVAQGPAAVVCQELRNDIEYYYTLWREGGNPRQKEVWRKLYQRNVWKYGNASCPRYLPNPKKAPAGSPKDVKPAVQTGQ